METAIQTVVKVFLKSAKGKESLGKKEVQNLVSSQLGNILSGADSKDAVNEMCQGLDSNSDGKLGFEEYMKLVGYLACSLSEQRVLNAEEQVQKAATAQSAPNNTEEQPKGNAEPKGEAKPEDAKVDTKADAKVEAQAEGEKKPEAAKEEAAKEEAAAATAEAPAANVKVAEKEPEKAEETVKVEEAAEKSPTATEGEKKTDEATS